MFDEHDPETGFAVGFAIAIAIFVALFTIGVALFATIPQRPAPIKVYFGAGEALMPAQAGVWLASVIAVAHADAGRKIVIPGNHDRSGEASFNTEPAKQRAYVVCDFFRAAGIADDRIVLNEPREALGGADDREARRVEVMLQ